MGLALLYQLHSIFHSTCIQNGNSGVEDAEGMRPVGVIEQIVFLTNVEQIPVRAHVNRDDLKSLTFGTLRSSASAKSYNSDFQRGFQSSSQL